MILSDRRRVVGGPSNSMERRVVLFLVLSLAVILGYDLLLKQLGLLPPPSDSVQETPTDTTSGTTTSGSSGGPEVPPPSSAGDRSSVKPGSPALHPAGPELTPVREQTVTIETDLL